MFVTVDGVSIFYETRGSGIPVVFLHGLGSSTRDWQFQLDAFEKHFHCVAIDLPGSGQSKAKGPFTLERFARAVSGVMKHLALEPAHLVGLSMGGMTSLRVAIDFPEQVRSLVVVNAVASVTPNSFKERFALTLRKLVTVFIGPPGVAKLVAPRLFPNPAHQALREQFIAQVSALDPLVYRQVSEAVLNAAIDSRVESIRCPVTLIAAGNDYTPVDAKERLAKRLKQARVIVVPDTHHALPIEAPELFNETLKNSLSPWGEGRGEG